MSNPVLPAADKLALVFPGQGSQFVGMGWDLCQRSPRARETFQETDDALGFSLSRLCFQGPEETLRETVNAQPAILTASMAYYRAAQEAGDPGESPAFVAGHSLGEYSALVAAGAQDFSDAVRLVRERGRLMQEAGRSRPGGMAAILGLEEDTVEELCRETGAEIANINAPGQIVISGDRRPLALALDLARARGARRVLPLEVSEAFHSSLMRSALEGMFRTLERFPLRDPVVPLVTNARAQVATTAQELRDALLWQLCNVVQWRRSVELMINHGVSTFVEVGPGKVLSGLIRRIGPEVQAYSLGEPREA